MVDRFPHAPSADAIESLARDAMRRLPGEFLDYLSDVVIRVDEFADRDTLLRVGLENPWQLLGLYHGRPVSEQSVWAAGDLPPMISLFRQPLLLQWKETGATLEAVITHVVVHEVGHHFGLSDEDMEAIENEAP